MRRVIEPLLRLLPAMGNCKGGGGGGGAVEGSKSISQIYIDYKSKCRHHSAMWQQTLPHLRHYLIYFISHDLFHKPRCIWSAHTCCPFISIPYKIPKKHNLFSPALCLCIIFNQYSMLRANSAQHLFKLGESQHCTCCCRIFIIMRE